MQAPRFIAHKIPPPVLALLIVGAMAWFAPHTPRFALGDAARWSLTLLIFGLGLAIELVAMISFRRAQTTVNPLKPHASAQLVTQGIFSYSRNPMYVGMCLQIVAAAMFLKAPAALLGVPAFVMLLTWLQILPEEQALRARFGPDYQAYCERVRRWL